MLRSPGQPLDAQNRAHFELWFGPLRGGKNRGRIRARALLEFGNIGLDIFASDEIDERRRGCNSMIKAYSECIENGGIDAQIRNSSKLGRRQEDSKPFEALVRASRRPRFPIRKSTFMT